MYVIHIYIYIYGERERKQMKRERKTCAMLSHLGRLLDLVGVGLDVSFSWMSDSASESYTGRPDDQTDGLRGERADGNKQTVGLMYVRPEE